MMAGWLVLKVRLEVCLAVADCLSAFRALRALGEEVLK